MQSNHRKTEHYNSMKRGGLFSQDKPIAPFRTQKSALIVILAGGICCAFFAYKISIYAPVIEATELLFIIKKV